MTTKFIITQSIVDLEGPTLRKVFESAFHAAIADGGECEVDLQWIGGIPSSVLAAIVALNRQLRVHGQAVRVTHLHDHMREVMTVTHLDRLLEIDPERQEVVA